MWLGACGIPMPGGYILQFAAWDRRIKAVSIGASSLFTGIKPEKLRNDSRIPKELSPTNIIGFEYPARKLSGKKKDRIPLSELVYYGRYGNSVTS